MIILDTDVVSGIMRAEKEAISWLNRQAASSIWTTAVTIFEIQCGLAVMPSGRRRSTTELAFRKVIEDDLSNRVLSFDRAAANEAAALMVARHRGGRIKESRDTMIAGIALAQNATLATRNVRHFDDLRVPVVDPWHA
jgi:predicted nucleic acid-binding protein